MSVGSVVFIQFVHYLLSFTTVNSKYSLVFCLLAYLKHCIWRLPMSQLTIDSLSSEALQTQRSQVTLGVEQPFHRGCISDIHDS